MGCIVADMEEARTPADRCVLRRVLTAASLDAVLGLRRRIRDETVAHWDEFVEASLTRLPFGPASPDHTAGAAFQMYYQIGNFVPWREAAWVLLSERAAILSRQCAETARHAGVPYAVSSAAAAAAGIAR